MYKRQPFVVVVSLPVALQAELGPNITLATTPSATVDSVKLTLERLVGSSASQQILQFNGATLLNGAATLASAGLANGDLLELTLPPPGSESLITITLPAAVHSSFGQSITIAAAVASDSVGDIKARLQSALGILVGQQVLTFSGTVLGNDAATLGSAGVAPGATLDLTGSVPSLSLIHI